MGEKFLGLRKTVLRNIVHLRPHIRKAHGQVVLGAMTATLGAFASGFATGLEAFDERTTKNERVIAGDASLLQYGTTLTVQRMIRVTDLGPSQMLIVLKCSSR